jgi:hypothetical protein
MYNLTTFGSYRKMSWFTAGSSVLTGRAAMEGTKTLSTETTLLQPKVALLQSI